MDNTLAVEILQNRLDCDATAYVNLRAIVPAEVWEKWVTIWIGDEGVDTDVQTKR